MKRVIIITVLIALVIGSHARQLKVACIGNSITYGAGIANRFQNAYPGILQQMLGEQFDVRNFGVSATTTLSRGNFPYRTTSAYREALAFQPDIVTIKLGTNDSKPYNWKYGSEFRRDLKEIIESFKTLTSHPKIYLCIPVPCTIYNRADINDSVIVNYITPIIRKVAAETGSVLVDLHTPLEGHSEFFPDTIHPTAEGSKVIASILYSAITGEEFSKEIETKSEWNGCPRYDFIFHGRKAIVVVPQKPLAGKPWIWRPAFFGAFPSVDIDLLQKGYHIVYLDVTHFYGNPWSVSLGTEFFNLMHETYGLSGKVVLEGLSRGGYYAFNWAAANPDKVACLYVDAPVCNIESWPGRTKNPQLWKDFLSCWNIEDSKVDNTFRGNAINLLTPIAKAGIPIIAVCGDSDKTVPYKENMEPVLKAYQALGGTVELILKPGCDHHPHSLENPEPISDFIMRYRSRYQDAHHITRRGLLGNSFHKFIKEKRGCVAFLGGSITEMKGWKDMIEEDLRQRFPECDFTFIEAGISSLGSTPHAFRMEQDLLNKGTPDLLFVEAAVNDDTNGFDAESQVRAMEGIVRHTLRINPSADIVMLHFIYDPFIPLHRDGIRPDVVMNHERVANHYRITSIDLIDEIATRMENGELTWEDFGGTHPAWYGSKFYAAAINHLFDMESAKTPVPHALPSPLDSLNYCNASLIPLEAATNLRGFAIRNDWMAKDSTVGTRKQYIHTPLLEATEPGSSLTLEFTGRAIGIYGTFGPASGIIEYSIDKAPYKKLNTHTVWSDSLYIPWLYVLEDELPAGSHTLRLRTSGECTIYRFAVNR